MVGMQMREHHATEVVDVERQTGFGARLRQDLADRVRTVDEQPGAACAQGEARRIVACREGIADAQR